jgi:hypothetical protein
VRLNLLVLSSLLLLSPPAGAHPEYAPTTVNHYLKLDLVAPTELRLAYTVMVGATPAVAARKGADANGDGHVDPGEARTLGDKQRQAVAAGVSLEVDGKRATLAFDPPEVGLAGDEVGPSPFSVDLIARVPLDGAGRHRLRLDDTTVEPALGDAEIRIDESPVTRLVSAFRGANDDGASAKDTRFLFRGPRFSALEDRSITVVFEGKPRAPGAVTPAAAQSGPRPGRTPKLILMFVAAGIAALIARRLMKQRRS